MTEVPDDLQPEGVQVAIALDALEDLVDELVEHGINKLVDRVTAERLAELARRPVPVQTGRLR